MTEFLIKNIISEIMFNSRVCESVEDQWIVNYIYDHLLLEKLLFGQPVTVPELRSLLRKKILNFEFIKLDGEVRPAKGTTMMKYVPPSQHPKGIRPSSPKVATFYDLKKDDWRSVSQRSKEIVLKKDEETGKPVVMVKDKPEAELAHSYRFGQYPGRNSSLLNDVVLELCPGQALVDKPACLGLPPRKALRNKELLGLAHADYPRQDQ